MDETKIDTVVNQLGVIKTRLQEMLTEESSQFEKLSDDEKETGEGLNIYDNINNLEEQQEVLDSVIVKLNSML